MMGAPLAFFWALLMQVHRNRQSGQLQRSWQSYLDKAIAAAASGRSDLMVMNLNIAKSMERSVRSGWLRHAGSAFFHGVLLFVIFSSNSYCNYATGKAWGSDLDHCKIEVYGSLLGEGFVVATAAIVLGLLLGSLWPRPSPARFGEVERLLTVIRNFSR
jgi:hypothetical protein